MIIVQRVLLHSIGIGIAIDYILYSIFRTRQLLFNTYFAHIGYRVKYSDPCPFPAALKLLPRTLNANPNPPAPGPGRQPLDPNSHKLNIKIKL